VQRILLIQTAFIGDVILATPVILELNRLFPNTELDVLVKKGNAVLLQNNPAINFVFEFDKSLGKTQEIVRLTKLFRQRRYDLTINLHRFGSSGLLTLLSGAKATYGFRKNPFSIFFSKRFDHRIGDGTHEVERNLSVIHELGAKLFVPPRLFIGFEEEAKTAVYKVQPYYCFAPASVWFTKQMPENKYTKRIRFG
jgi:ADP-heptose:LPS heptosyltransferase